MAIEAAPKLWNLAWELLVAGQNSPRTPFGTPVISTSSILGIPHSRVVVLRKAESSHGELICYTDRRSAKVFQLRAGSSIMSWAFWSPEHQIQFTCHGPTSELSGETCREILLDLPKHSRKPYAALLPPGSNLSEAGDGLPLDWQSRSLAETNYAADNFLILRTKITRAEVLQLSREGNSRLMAAYDKNHDWTFQWVVP